jgi:uncharacterized membrane protein YdjX (TVP38/TMEM64 family)
MAATHTAPEGSPPRTRHPDLAIGIAAIAAGLVIIAAVPQLRHCVWLVLHGKFGALHAYVHSLGVGGFLLLLGLMLAHAIIFYPSEIVTATAGYVYGFAPGLLFVIGGWLVAALLSYALGRAVGRPLLRAILGARFVRLERGMGRGGTSLLLAGRLFPVVPFALLGYAAGATRIGVWRFSWTTVLGYLPLTTAVAYLGSRAETLSATDPAVWIAAAALVAVIGAGWFVRQRRRA